MAALHRLSDREAAELDRLREENRVLTAEVDRLKSDRAIVMDKMIVKTECEVSHPAYYWVYHIGDDSAGRWERFDTREAAERGWMGMMGLGDEHG